jgi:hypothetical protein
MGEKCSGREIMRAGQKEGRKRKQNEWGLHRYLRRLGRREEERKEKKEKGYGDGTIFCPTNIKMGIASQGQTRPKKNEPRPFAKRRQNNKPSKHHFQAACLLGFEFPFHFGQLPHLFKIRVKGELN